MPQTTGTGMRSMRSSMRVDAAAYCVDHHCSSRQLLELAHVRADDKSLVLARQDDEAAHRLVARAGFDTLDDRPSSSSARRPSVLALTFTIKDRPGDPFVVNRELPVFQARR